ncbi:MAG: hypothetical protein Fur0016_03550 [Anaerolineales bacterium]
MDTKRNWPIYVFQSISLLVLGGITAVYLSHLGEPNPVEFITNLLTSGFALLATWLAISVWTFLRKDDPGRRQWAALAIGIGLWTMAELLWAFLSYTMAETPYPSIADAFWIPGYVMVLASATLRYRALKIQWNSMTSRLLLGIFAVIGAVVFALVILPILASEGTDRLWVLLLNIFYPIADLLLLFAAFLLAYSLAGGRFSTPWMTLAAGLATLSLSDILFIYSEWNGFYTSDGHLTWLTVIVDIGNLVAYVLIAYGVLLNQRLLAGGARPEQKSAHLPAQPTAAQKVMIFIDSSDRVVFANYNLSRLLSTGDSNTVRMPLGEVLRLSAQDEQSILAGLHNPRLGSIQKYITQYSPTGAEISGWLRAQANFNDLREYTGADITCDMEWQPDADTTRQVAGRFAFASYTLVFDSQEGKLLLDYFSRKVRALHQVVSQMGGAAVSRVFGEVFQAAVSKEDCAFSLQEGKMWVEKLPARAQSYARILAQLTEYASDTLSVELVSGICQQLDEDTGPEMLAAARKLGLTS